MKSLDIYVNTIKINYIKGGGIVKTIIFINTQKSGSSREAIKAAERLGYYTVLLTDKTNLLNQRKEFPDIHLMQLCNIKNIDDIRDSINQLIAMALEICLIISFVDPYCSLASKLCEEYCIDKFSTDAMGIMENKILSRQAIAKTKYNPNFFTMSGGRLIDKNEIIDSYPLIIKSPKSAGSKDVYKVHDYSEYVRVSKNIDAKYPDESILIEDFLDGPQYLIETVFFDNQIHFIAVIEQEITLGERFIITGYKLMHNIPRDFYVSLRDAVFSVFDSHGFTSGACHLEMRYVNRQWKLIEINPRISGAGMNRMIEIGLGINLVEETLKYALNKDYNIKPKHRFYCYAQYITVSKKGILAKVTGRNRAKNSNGVKAVYIKPRKGALLVPPLSMGNRYAYVIAVGDTEDDAEYNAKYAASLIEFSLKDSE